MRKNVIPQCGMQGGWAAGRLGGKRYCFYRAQVSVILLFAIVIGVVPPLAAEDGAPLEVVKVNVEKVLEVLSDPAMQEEAAVDRKKEAIRSISDDMFNWPLLSRGVLSIHWKKFTDDQQQEFVSLFKDILEQAYIDRILAYKDETIRYVSNQMLSSNKAEVVTHIISGGSPINLTYRLGLLDGKWGVYDVIVEGVSLTSNYRTQFREFLADQTPVELLEHLRKKVGEE